MRRHTRRVNASTFSALAEPSRFQIVELLREGPASVGEIATRLSLRQPQTSKHLRVLSDAGLIAAKPIAQRRVYALQPAPFQEMDRWLDTYRPTWDERLDAMEAHLRSLGSGTPDARN